MSAATGGIDVLVFTGGVGEGSATIRHRAAERLAYLGVAVDADRNDRGRDDRDITAATATCGPLVITAREDLQIAGDARRLLSTHSAEDEPDSARGERIKLLLPRARQIARPNENLRPMRGAPAGSRQSGRARPLPESAAGRALVTLTPATAGSPGRSGCRR
jgi:hypothetical protein